MIGKKFTITECTIQSSKLKKPYTIVQISDLHNCCNRIRRTLLVDSIKILNPDFIACTGDLFNRKDATQSTETFELLDKIIKIAPVFVIKGNHEFALGEVGERYLKELEEMGANLLLDNAQTIQDIKLIGLCEYPDVSLVDSFASDHLFNLVLSHRPELFELYSNTKADLVLSGHAHGGQIQVGSKALYAPEQGLFPKYTAGLYEKNNTKMFVSRGLGDTILIPRINNPHELNVIYLIPAE